MSDYVNIKGMPLVKDTSKKEMAGGEGVVWHVKDTQKLFPFPTVTKTYHSLPNPDQKAKIKAMLGVPPQQRDELLKFAAWPIDAAFEKSSKKLAGFVMPLAGNHKPVHKLYNPKDRRASFPQADWSFLACTAMNVARAFAEVHRFGHVAGDINHSNILIGQDATALLIDTDSFQISSGGRVHHCRVGIGEFLPPELFHKKLNSVTRNANHDNFSIAVMIFLLLCNGRHPFAGQDQGARILSLENAVEANAYAFGRAAKSKGIAPPSINSSIHPSDLPNDIAELFERAFDARGNTGGRPTAQEWAQTLQHSVLGNLQACPKSKKHHYIKGKSCPWCRLEGSRSTPVFGPVPTAPKTKGVSQQSRATAKAPPPPAASPQTYSPPKPRARGARRSQTSKPTSIWVDDPWFSFGGTIGGRGYFVRQLVVVIGALAVAAIAADANEPGFLFLWVFTAWLNLSSSAQRLRSIGWSPYLTIGMVVPYLNLVLLILLIFWRRRY